jgi:hypothetical protein
MPAPKTTGNFWKDMRRLLGFLWKKRQQRKSRPKGESKVMKRLKREFYK